MSTIPQIKDQLVTKVDRFVQNVGYTEAQDTTKVPDSGGNQEWMMEAAVRSATCPKNDAFLPALGFLALGRVSQDIEWETLSCRLWDTSLATELERTCCLLMANGSA